MLKFIDITQELFSCKVYPGDPTPTYDRLMHMPRDPYQLTSISICLHNGTHIDAPLHFIEGGKAVDEIDLSACFGDCLVAENVAGNLHEERLLLKGTAEITAALAQEIASSSIRLLGVESQSVGPIDAPGEVHRMLLGAGIILLEGLDLSSALPGRYTLSAFPLKLGSCEGSPVRAVLIKHEEDASI